MSEGVWLHGRKLAFPAADGSRGWRFAKRPGGWWIAERTRESGELERVRVAFAEGRGRSGASIGGSLWQGDLWVAERGSGGGGGGDDFTAQFPGKVRKILVADGHRVAAGDPLVLVEAMKMEFAVRAPSQGTVTRLLVQEGQTLSPGDRILEWEGADGG